MSIIMMLLPEAHHRDDPAPEVDDPFHIGGRIGHLRDLGHPVNLLHLQDVHCVLLAAESEGHQLKYP
jgi:hypothetical protein